MKIKNIRRILAMRIAQYEATKAKPYPGSGPFTRPSGYHKPGSLNERAS